MTLTDAFLDSEVDTMGKFLKEGVENLVGEDKVSTCSPVPGEAETYWEGEEIL